MTEKLNKVSTKEQIVTVFAPLFKQNGIKSAVLFGSFAKGTDRDESDIDLLVDSGLHGFDFLNFVADLEEAGGRSVDCFDVSHIIEGSEIDKEIQRTGVVVYA